MIKYFLMLIIFSSNAFANQDEDKNCGTCAMYLYLAKAGNFGNYKVNALDALNLSSNQNRAIQYGKMYADKIADYQSRKKDVSPLITQGVKSCYDIGLSLR